MKKALLITALWCPSCLLMRPRYQAVLAEFGVTVEELDFDMDGVRFDAYKIGTTLPVLILFQSEKEVNRIVGEKTKVELIDILEKTYV